MAPGLRSGMAQRSARVIHAQRVSELFAGAGSTAALFSLQLPIETLVSLRSQKTKVLCCLQNPAPGHSLHGMGPVRMFLGSKAF